MEEEYIRLIFGLKLRQKRNERNLSLFGLSKLTGLSKSYLNEIENGKKYPKPDKIALLSTGLEVPYDQMVSLKLDKKLAPIGELLRSKMFKEIPLELFGIKESDLIDIVANAPLKVSAFISTIIKIAQHYDFSRESFYLASVRSYQEANKNYFGDLEESVLRFAEAYQIDLGQPISDKDLAEVLIEEYGYTIHFDALRPEGPLNNLRSVFVPKTKVLLMADGMDEAQRTFIYAKEIAYNYLGYQERLYTFPWIKFDTFDQVLNNFYASYFAGALIIPRATIHQALTEVFARPNFDTEGFLQLMGLFNASPESFYQRLTNILPKVFNIQDLFFLRFSHKAGSTSYELKKELHLAHQQSPRAYETNEHYCRRWVSLKVLDRIGASNLAHEFDVQVSAYEDGGKYLVFTSATQDPFKTGYYRSISVGLLINAELKRKLAFLNDPKIGTEKVGVTCERCPITVCELRQAPAKVLDSVAKNKAMAMRVAELMREYGNSTKQTKV